MNVLKFYAPTPREALRAARETLGEHAVVLSSRSAHGGAELVVMAGADIDALAGATSATASPGMKAAARASVIPGAGIHVPLAGPAGQTTVSAAEAAANSAANSATASPRPASQIIADHEFRDELKDELRSMRGMLETQLATLAWNGRQPEARARVLRAMLAAGFSAGLSRYIAEHMPEQAMADEARGDAWMREILQRNLNVLDSDDRLLEQGGVFALVGPTGVGKTTTTAKLAARCVARHGAARLALVTTDAYRIGAFEQLRIYGKLLGVMVHSVRDAADLEIALGELRHKHIVLIDTAGASQRD